MVSFHVFFKIKKSQQFTAVWSWLVQLWLDCLLNKRLGWSGPSGPLRTGHFNSSVMKKNSTLTPPWHWNPYDLNLWKNHWLQWLKKNIDKPLIGLWDVTNYLWKPLMYQRKVTFDEVYQGYIWRVTDVIFATTTKKIILQIHPPSLQNSCFPTKHNEKDLKYKILKNRHPKCGYSYSKLLLKCTKPKNKIKIKIARIYIFIYIKNILIHFMC